MDTATIIVNKLFDIFVAVVVAVVTTISEPSNTSTSPTSSPTTEALATPIPSATPQPKKITVQTSQNSNNVDCVGPDGKQFSTTMAECKTLNEKWGKTVDYIVDCSISDQCGGGSIKMKNSECDNAICCIYPNNPVFMRDKSKCVSSTSTKTQTTSTSSKVAFTTNYASTKGTYYCSDSAVNRILNQEEKTVKQAYDFMQNGCGGGYSDTFCQGGKDAFRKAQSDLDADIRQYCP